MTMSPPTLAPVKDSGAKRDDEDIGSACSSLSGQRSSAPSWAVWA